MGKHKSTPEQKRKRLLYFVIVVAALFVLRIVLLRTGRIQGTQALNSEELQGVLEESQVLVSAGDLTARGTLMQIQEPTGLHRDEKATTYYILTTGEIAKAAEELENANQSGGVSGSDTNDETGAGDASGVETSDESRNNTGDKDETFPGLDGSCNITDSSGTTAPASFVSRSSDGSMGVLSYSSKDYEPSAVADSVYFSENALYQLKEGDTVYYQAGNTDPVSGLRSTPIKGSFISKSTMVDGVDGHWMIFTPDGGVDTLPAAGSGVFSETGSFLGMVVEVDPSTGNVLCVPGNTAVDYFRTNH